MLAFETLPPMDPELWALPSQEQLLRAGRLAEQAAEMVPSFEALPPMNPELTPSQEQLLRAAREEREPLQTQTQTQTQTLPRKLQQLQKWWTASALSNSPSWQAFEQEVELIDQTLQTLAVTIEQAQRTVQDELEAFRVKRRELRKS